ncbi:MAG: aromatic amino acid ammonia-lyase [bacterium]|nr:aromatic amino acid ammonia-lyase [bacterium]
MKRLLITPNMEISYQEVCKVASGKISLKLTPATFRAIEETYSFVTNRENRDKVYGIDTGVADFSTVPIRENQLSQMQVNMLRSHSAGLGHPLPKEVVRSIIFSRILTLARGHSKIRPLTLQLLVDLLNYGITPVVPELGAIGCGDLQPLACIGLVLLGEGEVEYQGEHMKAQKAMKKAGIVPMKELTIEALSLIDGNSAVIGLGSILAEEVKQLIQLFTISSSLVIEGRQGTIAPFDHHVSLARKFIGQSDISKTIAALLQGSSILESTSNSRGMLQDPVSIRSTPQVIGTALDSLRSLIDVLGIEINSAGDNPVIFAKEKMVVQAANFMSLQLGTQLDMVVKNISNITSYATSTMQIMTNPIYNEGLPKYLIQNPGINSGLMIPIYTAQGINSEIIASTFPRSALMVGVANGWEDISSGSWNSALNLRRIIRLSKHILALHFLYGMQSISLRKKIRLGRNTKKIYDYLNLHLNHSFPITTDIRYDYLVSHIETIVSGAGFYDLILRTSPKLF